MDSKMASDTKYPIPGAPAVNILALNTDFVTDQPLTLIMKGKHFSNDVVFKTTEDQVLFQTDAKAFSASSRTRLIDSRSQNELFTIRRRPWGRYFRHYAEFPPEGSGNMIFESESHTKLLKGVTTTITFANVANNGVKEQIDMKEGTFSRNVEIMWHDKQIGGIRGEGLHMTPHYILDIAAGVDPILVIVLAIIKLERDNTQQAGAAPGTAAGAAAAC